MSSKLIRDAVLVSAIIAGGFLALTQREAIYDFIGLHPADIVEARANRLGENPAQIPTDTTAMIV